VHSEIMCASYCCANGGQMRLEFGLLPDILMAHIRQYRHGTTGGVEIICRSWLDVSGNGVMMIISFVLSTNLFSQTTRRSYMV